MNNLTHFPLSEGLRGALIADSGATKTDWCLTRNGEILHRFSSKGISPVFQTQEEIAEEIKLHVYPVFKKWDISAVYFYGTGCIPEKIQSVKNAVSQSFQAGTIEVYSDLIAAAHSLCGHSSGIACIMGTGSNSCEWSGNEIVKQVSPLGFILGDEGSGAALGKQLVSDALKNQLSEGLKEKLLKQYNLSQADIIDKVYRQPFPSRFLASLSPFVLENIGDPSIRNIVERSFTDFFERNVMQYNYQKNNVNFVGSIAFYFEEILKEAAKKKGIQIGKIEKSPMPGLVEYYNPL
ncbi:MAG: ATPase [Petrimonas sp.]|nr:ATPase [Petrimonas sp.]